MPHRLNEFRAKIQFVTSAQMPSLIYQAVVKTGTISNTNYIQRAVAEALARDLGLRLEDILAALPPPRGPSAVPFGADRKPHPGPGNTVEEVK